MCRLDRTDCQIIRRMNLVRVDELPLHGVYLEKAVHKLTVRHLRRQTLQIYRLDLCIWYIWSNQPKSFMMIALSLPSPWQVLYRLNTIPYKATQGAVLWAVSNTFVVIARRWRSAQHKIYSLGAVDLVKAYGCYTYNAYLVEPATTHSSGRSHYRHPAVPRMLRLGSMDFKAT